MKNAVVYFILYLKCTAAFLVLYQKTTCFLVKKSTACDYAQLRARNKSSYLGSSHLARQSIAVAAAEGKVENMEKKQIIPVQEIRNKHISVAVPGSKSITNRAMLLAVLADGVSVLENVLFSDDSRYFLSCVQGLGFETRVSEAAHRIEIKGLGGLVPKSAAAIYVGSAGTAARFLAAYLGCSRGVFYLDASAQMRKRPMEPLLKALESVGARIRCTEELGHFPLEIEGFGICKQHITIDIDKSSQFLSALLIAGCLSKEDLYIHVKGSHGMAYIEMTIAMMAQFGVKVERAAKDTFLIRAGQQYEARAYRVEPDASAAAYFWAMAAVLGISVLVEHTHFESLQGDVEFARILQQMGCRVEDTEAGIVVTGPENGVLKGIDVDMHTCSDQAITLAAIAPFADGPVRIRGISHIRLQESDRIAAIVENLTAMGIKVKEMSDGVTIYPGTPHGAEIQTHDDHRLAMGFAITGLRCPDITILNPSCCRKTFEHFFDVLEEACAQL